MFLQQRGTTHRASATLPFDSELLARYPEGYRHLAYLQRRNGFQVKNGLPKMRGPEIEKL
jgi:hypothetical protein